MPDITVDAEVFARLQSLAQPFVDTPNDVLRRALGIAAAQERGEQTEPGLRKLTNSEGRSTRPTAKPAETRDADDATPQREFRQFILASLRDAGGLQTVDQVLFEVERRMRSRFREADYELVSKGEVKWRNAARWERNDMVDDGLIKKSVRRGVWELTELGMSRN
ncbi:hypothetical protein JOE40_001299 [Arthrobacter sp. PvP102]|uniref:winged helix-turn-helix domain-containing protein n=1 Tax=unclassified Arthrobacter TaxID=235627 RepID=UPI001AE49614|nr:MULTISPECIES: winged helix-turn-helix domain-containing protein [unclassified Arthrobacter]MBP1231655.1 hypothetical protein [Arthrobacter sp. PvP103]MBP1236790.1 hypothetical protein [Arthrobacter sp. PvP102]